MKAETAEKKCWNPNCKRIIVGDSKLGLCSRCFNRYGSVASLGIPVVVGTIWKNKGKIFSVAINAIKYIKP